MTPSSRRTPGEASWTTGAPFRMPSSASAARSLRKRRSPAIPSTSSAPVVGGVLAGLEYLEATVPELVETVESLRELYNAITVGLKALLDDGSSGSAEQADSETGEAVAQWAEGVGAFTGAVSLALKAMQLPAVAHYFGLADEIAHRCRISKQGI